MGQRKPSAETITANQAAMMVSKAMIGTGILILPQSVSLAVNTPDGWLSVLLSGFVALLAGWIVGLLCRRFPGRGFYAYVGDIIGRPLGACVVVLVSVYYLSSAGYLLRVMGEVIRMYLLDKTPIMVTMVLFMLVANYLTVGGINPIARLIELFMPIIVCILMVLIVFSFRDFELDNVRPVLGQGLLPVLQGMPSSILSYSGFEVLLFLGGFMKMSRKAVPAVLAGIGLTTVLYTLIVLVTIGSLTVEEVKTVTWPTMSVAMNIELPDGFFERFESLFTVLWVLSMYTAYVLYQYGACLGAAQLYGKDFRVWSYIVMPIIFAIAVLPDNLNAVFALGEYNSYASLLMFGLLPVILLAVAAVRRIGNEQAS